MERLTVKDIVEATGGRRINGHNGYETEFQGVSIDSRTIKDGDLFVALKGSLFDGHDFLLQAMQKGSGAIVSIPPAVPYKGKVIIHADNTLRALQSLAIYLRKKYAPRVIGITGTNGKTTTKEMAASVLGAKFKVLKNTGNLNNQIGLPLSLLNLDRTHEVAVLEMGASIPGDIAELCSIAAPEYGVVTNLGHAHIEGFGSIEALRKTKLELLQCAGTVFLNADDPFLMEGIRGYSGNIIRFGMGKNSDVSASGIENTASGTSFLLNAGGESVRIRLRIAGYFNVYNALAASAVGLHMGVGMDGIRKALESFDAVTMRFRIAAYKGATVISDVYNANPSSMEEAVKELVRLRKERTVAVLGDMLELGAYAETAHLRLGEMMSNLPVDVFIAVGPLMAKAAGAFKGKSIVVQDSASAREALLGEFRPGDTILVKGSRGMKMERVIEDAV